jgi:crossover junction endodeoxyribonuclease RuvC
MKILGIDPGLQRTGFGVIHVDGSRLSYVASGTISTLEAPRGDLPLRLKIIFEGVREVVERYTPDCATVEIVFVNVNPQSTLLWARRAVPRWRRWCPVACRWRSTPRCR